MMPIRAFPARSLSVGATVLLFLCALLLTACSKTEQPADAAEAARQAQVQAAMEARDQIAAQESSFTPVTATWSLGGTSSEITGFYQGDSLRMIREEMSMGDFGSTSARYFYAPDGKLTAYTESKQARSGASTGSATTEQIELDLLFSESGSLLSGQRTANGAAAPLVGIEEQGVRMHARELEAALADARASAK